MQTIINKIIETPDLKKHYLPIEDFPIPQPFVYNKKQVRAIILGADPSNFSNNKQTVKLRTVFGIGSGNPDYFRKIMNNLVLIGLGLSDIYVQNVVPHYMNVKTTSNKHWKHFATLWMDHLKEELNKIDPNKKVPVLVTAEKIYISVLNKNEKPQKAGTLYNKLKLIPIPSDKNLLNRPIIPLFRHQDYHLKNWEAYTFKLKKIFQT